MSHRHEDLHFMPSVEAVNRGGLGWMAHGLLFSIIAFVIIALLWADWATLDEVTHGDGKVIPSSQLQVVQNLEGGIVSEILVREGDQIDNDQVLLRIDDTRFSSSFRESRLRYLATLASVARLTAEADARDLDMPEEVKNERPELGRSERALYRSRQAELNSTIAILQKQVEQRQQELTELKARRGQLRTSHDLARKELEITEPLVKQGIMSEVELLRLQRTVNELKGDLEANKLASPRAQSAINEARQKIEEQRLRFRSEARDELNQQQDELSRLSESIRAQEDRVTRTTVRSPVKGIVQRMMVNTIGGVVQPGMDLVEIVPLEDSLLIEARIRPSDIAFVRPGQEATIKLSAYDYSIYGGLPAKLEHISADTIRDERGESFYQIRLRTQQNYIGNDAEPLPIIPGMTATVDILTGKKSVLDYLLKPIRKAQERALRER